MAACKTQISEQLEEDFLQCKICFEVYRTPRTLSCLHSFCEPCLEQLLDKQKGTVTCPECRTVIDLQGCVRNAKASFFINSLLDLFRSKTTKETFCSLCPALGKTVVPASSRCLDCADFLCTSCAQGHCLSKLTLGHQVVSLQDYASGCYDEEARSKEERRCESHQEPLRFYCSTCSSSICRDCRMLEHFSHQVLSLAQATTARRPQLEELISSLDGSMRSLSQQEQEVDSAIQQLKEAENVIKDQLSGHISAVLEQLFSQQDAICKELAIFVEQKEKEYLSVKKELRGHINSAENTKDFSTQVMQKGKDYEILDLEGTIQSQIERLQKLSIAEVERKTPLVMIKDLNTDSFSGIYQLRFDVPSESLKNPTVVDTSVKAEPETSAQTAAEACPQIAIAPQHEQPMLRIEAKPQPKVHSQQNTQAQPQSKQKTQPEPQSKQKTQPEPQSKQKTQPELQSKQKTQSQKQSKQKAQPEPQSKEKAQSQPQSKKVQPEPQSKEKTQPQSKRAQSRTQSAQKVQPQLMPAMVPQLSFGVPNCYLSTPVTFIQSFDIDCLHCDKNITGLSVFPCGDIVFADNRHSVINRLYRKENITAMLCTWIDPFCIAVCNNNVFFISGCQLFKVQDSGTIELVTDLDWTGTRMQYAIAAYKNKYVAVSEVASCRLTLYNPWGRKAGRVNPNYNGGRFAYLAVNSREEFIASDTVKKCIVIFRRNGEVINMCTYIDTFSFNPGSVCVDTSDNIYVIEGGRVILLTPWGQFVRVLLDFHDGYSPKLITADHSGRLILVDWAGMVRIYKV